MKFPSAAIFQCEPDACFFSAVHKNYTGLSVIAEAFSCIIAFHILYQLLQNSKEQFEGCSITHLFSASVVCSFYAEFLTLLAVLSSEMVHGEKKKPLLSGNLILGNNKYSGDQYQSLHPKNYKQQHLVEAVRTASLTQGIFHYSLHQRFKCLIASPQKRNLNLSILLEKKMPFKRKYFKRLRGVWFFMCFLQLNDITCQNLNGVYSEMQVKICQELWSQINYLEYINFPGISVQKPVQKYNVINRRFCWERFSQRWFLYSSVSA